ncbi:MAG: hypothetical protein L0207_05170 [Chlamydiae bacterium]|nr:hypothetical protein [Chlamydiota bacterium]
MKIALSLLLIMNLFFTLGEGDEKNFVNFIISPGQEQELLGIDGKNVSPRTLLAAIKELIGGISDTYFGEEFFKKIAKAQGEKSTGEYEERWENGQIKIKAFFKNGFVDGHLHGWYSDGQDAFKGYFKEGKKLGIHIAFYPPGEGRRASDPIARVLTFSEEGKIDDEQTVLFPDGRLKALITYKNGVLDGQTILLDEEGKRIKEWTYKKGKLVTERLKAKS